MSVFCAMMLNSQSEEPIHFQSESADNNCTQIKTNVEPICKLTLNNLFERFSVMTLNSQSEEPIHFVSEWANRIARK